MSTGSGAQGSQLPKTRGAETLNPPTSPATDRDARFAKLVRDQRDKAVGLAWRLLGGDRAAAEDVAQEAFLRAYRGLGGFREESALSTWFFRILVREAQRHRRWRSVRERLGGAPGDDPPGPLEGDWPDVDPAPQTDPALRRRIARALAGLSRGQREAFVMVHLEGFSVAGTADIVGRSPGTIKTHLHRARRALQAELGDLAPDGQTVAVAAGQETHDPIRA